MARSFHSREIAELAPRTGSSFQNIVGLSRQQRHHSFKRQIQCHFFVFISQPKNRQQNKHTACPLLSTLFLASPQKNVRAGHFCSVWINSSAEEYERFCFLFNLYCAEKGSLKMLSLGAESLPGCLCRVIPLQIVQKGRHSLLFLSWKQTCK